MTATLQFSSFKSLRIVPISTVTLLMLAGLYGCRDLATSEAQSSPQTTKISHLQNRKSAAKVYVRGNVQEQAPFLGAGAYQLEDPTGSVWIFTTTPLPGLGKEMLVHGQVSYETIMLEGLKEQDIGEVYLKELERIQAEPQASPDPS
ncbi:MAG: hypothetical protein ACRC8A_14200 [Microcoleaceae cyanobacterium]